MMILELAPTVAVMMRFVLSVAAAVRCAVFPAFTMVMSTASSQSRGRQADHRGNAPFNNTIEMVTGPFIDICISLFAVGMLTGRAYGLMPSVQTPCAKSHTVDMSGVSGPAMRRPVDGRCPKTRMLARSAREGGEYRSTRVHLGDAR